MYKKNYTPKHIEKYVSVYPCVSVLRVSQMGLTYKII